MHFTHREITLMLGIPLISYKAETADVENLRVGAVIQRFEISARHRIRVQLACFLTSVPVLVAVPASVVRALTCVQSPV